MYSMQNLHLYCIVIHLHMYYVIRLFWNSCSSVSILFCSSASFTGEKNCFIADNNTDQLQVYFLIFGARLKSWISEDRELLWLIFGIFFFTFIESLCCPLFSFFWQPSRKGSISTALHISFLLKSSETKIKLHINAHRWLHGVNPLWL